MRSSIHNLPRRCRAVRREPHAHESNSASCVWRVLRRCGGDAAVGVCGCRMQPCSHIKVRSRLVGCDRESSFVASTLTRVFHRVCIPRTSHRVFIGRCVCLARVAAVPQVPPLRLRRRFTRTTLLAPHRRRCTRTCLDFAARCPGRRRARSSGPRRRQSRVMTRTQRRTTKPTTMMLGNTTHVMVMLGFDSWRCRSGK